MHASDGVQINTTRVTCVYCIGDEHSKTELMCALHADEYV